MSYEMRFPILGAAEGSHRKSTCPVRALPALQKTSCELVGVSLYGRR